MLVHFLKKNPTPSIILLPVLTILLWLPVFLKPTAFPVTDTLSAPLYELLYQNIKYFPLLSQILSIAIIVVSGFLLNHLLEKYNILTKHSYLPAYIYILLMCSYYPLLTMHPILIVSLFFLLALNKILQMHRKEKVFSEVFDASFLLSIASLFYFPATLIFPIVWIALIIFRPFIWREWIISLTGLLIPYLFVTVYYFWIDQLPVLFSEKIQLNVSVALFSVTVTPALLLLLSIISLILLLSWINLYWTKISPTILFKNTFILLIFFSILSLIACFFSYSYPVQFTSLFFIPFTFYFSNFFLDSKRTFWIELLFALLVLTVVYDKIEFYLK